MTARAVSIHRIQAKMSAHAVVIVRLKSRPPFQLTLRLVYRVKILRSALHYAQRELKLTLRTLRSVIPEPNSFQTPCVFRLGGHLKEKNYIGIPHRPRFLSETDLYFVSGTSEYPLYRACLAQRLAHVIRWIKRYRDARSQYSAQYDFAFYVLRGGYCSKKSFLTGPPRWRERFNPPPPLWRSVK